MQPDLKNKQLPKGWVKDRIGSRVRVNYGKSQSGIRETGGKIPIYGTGGLIEHGKEALCLGDSVLIGRKGTLGNPLYLEHPFWPVDTTYYTSDFDGCTKWFFYLVQTLSLEKLNEATGVPSLSRGTFNRLEVPFPPKPEQEKIAEILTTIDQAIEQKAALITKYQRIKMGLMQDLFTCGIDENGCLRNPSTHKFKPSPLGQIPEEWKCVRSEELCFNICVGIVIKPSQYYRDTGVPTLRSANVREHGIESENMVFISEEANRMLAKSMLCEGYVVSVRTGYPGTSAVIPPGLDGANCVDLVISKPGPKILPQYLSLWINSPFGKDQVLKAQGGLAQQHFNVSDMKNLLVLCPNVHEQQTILDILNSQSETLRFEYRRLAKLKRLKTGLMQDLLTGKVSVEPLLAEEAITR